MYSSKTIEVSDSSSDEDSLNVINNQKDLVNEDIKEEEKNFKKNDNVVKKNLKEKDDTLLLKSSIRSRKSIKKIAKLTKWKNKEKKISKDEEEEGEPDKKEYYFMQNLNSFRDISKKMFKEVNSFSEDNQNANELENHVSFSYLVQYKFIVFVQFIQGFLTGLTTAQALSTYLFSSLETFLEGYKVIAVPAHATFFILFTLSTILALENFKTKEKKIISFIYELFTFKVDSWAIFIWVAGSVTNLSLLRYDEKIGVFSVDLLKNQNDINELMVWRILGCIRASFSTIGWFLTIKQDKQQLLIPLVEKDSEEDKKRM